MQKMKNIDILLEDIQKRPGVYIGEKSLDRLVDFLDGYIQYAIEQNDNYCADYLLGFQEFVFDKYNVTTAHGWVQIINFYSYNQAAEAFDTFFELLKEFKQKG